MPELRVQVDAEVADALETEAGLLGFEHEEAYLAWIVENRAAIEQGTESAELLAAYRRRLVALEERLAEAGVDPDAVPGEPVADPSTDPAGAGPADAESGAGEPTDAAPPAASASAALDAVEDTSAADAADADAAGAAEVTNTAESTSAADAADDADTTNTADTTSTPDAADVDAANAGDADADAVPTAGAASGQSGGAGANAADGAGPAASDGGAAADADVTSMHLRPERVQRINEDPVARDAGELRDVEAHRVDEMSRRAVAETRRQLDRDVETGLDYDSSAAMPGSDVRPGEDLADLDDIDVPGRDASLVERRREVVGRALALLRDEGRVRRSDVVEALYEDHPVGYETPDGWWRCVREGLDQVDAVDGGHVWEYER